MGEYFPELKSSGGRVKVELYLSNYAIKADLKNATGAATSKFAKKVDLTNLKSNAGTLDIHKLKNVRTNLSNVKSKVDKLDVDKLVPVPVDISKLSDVEKNVIKKDKLLDITNLATNASLNAKINEVKGEIPSITNLATIASLNVKKNEIKNKIPIITNLATALAAIENKILNVRII